MGFAFLEPPNNKFKGSQNIVTTTIRQGDGRAGNVNYKKDDYFGVMIIKDEIILSKIGYQLAIDLVQTGNAPIGYTQSEIRIIRQQIFNHNPPKIVASLYDPFIT